MACKLKSYASLLRELVALVHQVEGLCHPTRLQNDQNHHAPLSSSIVTVVSCRRLLLRNHKPVNAFVVVAALLHALQVIVNLSGRIPTKVVQDVKFHKKSYPGHSRQILAME